MFGVAKRLLQQLLSALWLVPGLHQKLRQSFQLLGSQRLHG